MTRSGKLVYTLFTENSTFSTPPTTVMAADGRIVADMAWGGLTHASRITFNGYTCPSLLEKRKVAWYKKADYYFHDHLGNEFMWRDTALYTGNNHLVAAYKRERMHLTKDSEKAELSVDGTFLPILDLIMCTALEVENLRRQDEGATTSVLTGSAVVALTT